MTRQDMENLMRQSIGGFAGDYKTLLNEIMQHGHAEKNERTGVEILAHRGGHSFLLDLSDNLLPVANNRKYFPHIAAAEVAWQFLGTKDPEFILSKAPKLWSKFVEDGELKTAYGYRWREHFKRDQLFLAMEQLRTNPTNRQLFISAWDPATDGLGGPQPKNIPCPVGFTLSALNGELNCSVFIRSSDVFVGLPYDVMGYALTMDAIAESVGLKMGTLHVTLAHPHLYEPHWTMAQVDKYHYNGSSVSSSLPAWSVEDIIADPDGYVGQVKRLAKRVKVDHPWNPLPELIE